MSFSVEVKLSSYDERRMHRGYSLARKILATNHALRTRGESKPIETFIPSAKMAGNGYWVNLSHWICQCMDFEQEDSECKHMWALCFVARTLLSNRCNALVSRAVTSELRYTHTKPPEKEFSLDAAAAWYIACDAVEEGMTESNREVFRAFQAMARSRGEMLEQNEFLFVPTILIELWKNTYAELEIASPGRSG